LSLQKKSPHTKDLGDQWRARLLGAILSVGIPVTFILLVVTFIISRGFSLDGLLAASALLFEIAVWLIWRRWGLNPAAVILVLGASLLCAICVSYSGGIASVALVGQAFIIVVAALLTNSGLTLGLLAAVTVFNFVLLINGGSQLMVDPILNDGPVMRFSMQTAILILCSAIVLYSNRIMRALTLNLANSEYRFRALFEKTSDAVFIANMDLRLIEANEQAARILAYRPEELAGLPIRRLFPPDEWDDVQRRFDAVKSAASLPPTTRRFVTKTGAELMLETNLALVQDQDGNPLHYQSTGRDVTQKVMEQQRMASTLVHMTVKASTDSLTGVLNRETILQHAEAEWERYLRNPQPLSVMMGDMDQLKKINDTYGHLAGDQALNAVARAIDQHKRPYDWVGRYGGDEFLVILPGSTRKEAQAIARRIENAIGKERVKTGKRSVVLSCCLGVASSDGHEPPIRNMSELIELADVALYKAKRRKKK
jgi:diguanylate cyclase (GGDEF)-like protein/PAS domain S-box-containing protein